MEVETKVIRLFPFRKTGLNPYQIALALGCGLEHEANKGNKTAMEMCIEWWSFVDGFETLSRPQRILGTNRLIKEMRQRLGVPLTAKSVRESWKLCVIEIEKQLREACRLKGANVTQFPGIYYADSDPDNIA